MTSCLTRLADRVRRDSGMSLGDERLAYLRAAVMRAWDLSPEAFEQQLEDPRRATVLMSGLIDEITIKETSLFRHPDELAAIDWHAMLRRAQAAGRSRVRVWCAACSTGQEAYTLAILALEAFGPGPAPVDILATDIARGALADAAAGRYGPRCARQLPAGMHQRWFVPDGGGVRVDEAVRRHVRFARHNLVGDRFPPANEGPFDLVTCRNVLIYFRREQAARTVAGLEGALVPGGRLLLGTADRLTISAATQSSMPRARRRVTSSTTDGRPSRSRHAPTRTAAADTPDAAACLTEGRAARTRGDAQTAAVWLRRALYLDPGCAEAGLELALAHIALQDTAAARRALAIALNTVVGRGCAEAGDTDLAAECRARLATTTTV